MKSFAKLIIVSMMCIFLFHGCTQKKVLSTSGTNDRVIIIEEDHFKIAENHYDYLAENFESEYGQLNEIRVGMINEEYYLILHFSNSVKTHSVHAVPLTEEMATVTEVSHKCDGKCRNNFCESCAFEKDGEKITGCKCDDTGIGTQFRCCVHTTSSTTTYTVQGIAPSSSYIELNRIDDISF